MTEPAPRLRLDPTRCDAAGYCAEIVPELVVLDDWGYPIVDRRPIPEGRLIQLASRAVAQCPRVALVLTTEPDRA
jgi:ferredoxin